LCRAAYRKEENKKTPWEKPFHIHKGTECFCLIRNVLSQGGFQKTVSDDSKRNRKIGYNKSGKPTVDQPLFVIKVVPAAYFK
jgi:hypothetical protein